MEQTFIIPPFTEESAKLKVKLVEDAWNSKDPLKVAKTFTLNTVWRHRDTFIRGRKEVKNFLSTKWNNELYYQIKNELYAFTDNIMAVRFEYEYQNKDGQWYRAYGNEICEFDTNGLIQKRFASIKDLKIAASDRRLWAQAQTVYELKKQKSMQNTWSCNSMICDRL